MLLLLLLAPDSTRKAMLQQLQLKLPSSGLLLCYFVVKTWPSPVENGCRRSASFHSLPPQHQKPQTHLAADFMRYCCRCNSCH
jgi:hypothetical protein